MRNVVLLGFLVLGSLVLGKPISDKQLVEKLVQAGQVVRFEHVRLGAPLAGHSLERKYRLQVTDPNDQVVTVEWFLAVAKGAKHVFKSGITLPQGSDIGNSGFALGLVVGIVLQSCLGVSPGAASEVRDWFVSRLEMLLERSRGQYEKAFGPIHVAFIGNAPLGIGELAVAISRAGKPGTGWDSYCTIAP